MRRIPLTPRARKFAALAVMVVAVLVVGQTLGRVAPREVEVLVPLARFRDPPDTARAISVEFARDGELVRAVSERFRGIPPAAWRQSLSLAPGGYAATVRVELDGRSAVGESRVAVRAGASVELPPPSAP